MFLFIFYSKTYIDFLIVREKKLIIVAKFFKAFPKILLIPHSLKKNTNMTPKKLIQIYDKLTQ